MAYGADQKPSGLSTLSDLANDDTVIVGDTSDVNEVVKTISWTNLKTAIQTAVEAYASYFNKSTDTLDDITTGSTNVHFTSSDNTKLDAIEASADVTDATNVAAAGAVMADGSGNDITGDIVFTEKADHSSTPGAGKGYVWVKNDAPSSLIFTDDAGTDYDLTSYGTGDMAASTYDPASIAEQLVGLTATQTLTNKTITQPTITLKQGTAPTPTAEGDIQWDTDDNKLKVGDGASTKTFSDDSYNSSTFAAASHNHAASDINSGTLAHERGGLEADVSAYSGLLKISGGSTSQAVAGTDYLSAVSQDTTPQAGGDFDVNGNFLGDATEYDNGNSSTADTVDWDNGNFQKSTLTANCTYTFNAPTLKGRCQLRVIQDATGSRTVTWPATVKWPGGTAPTLSTAANAIDIITFFYDGTNYYGVDSLNFS